MTQPTIAYLNAATPCEDCAHSHGLHGHGTRSLGGNGSPSWCRAAGCHCNTFVKPAAVIA